MTDVSIREQRQIVHDCFSQNIPRDCPNCPAHHSAGGICCFSDSGKFDDDDPECSDCVFHDECLEEVFDEVGFKQKERDEWFQQRYGRLPPNRESRLRVIQPTARRVAEPEERSSGKLVRVNGQVALRPKVITAEEQEELAPDETLFHRFAKDFVWGAMQGAFEMGVQFFRSHRLP